MVKQSENIYKQLKMHRIESNMRTTDERMLL